MTRPDGYDALPKRFKDYIGKLESEVRHLLKSRPTPEPTSISLVNYGDGQTAYLPEGTRIEFAIGKERFQVYASTNSLHGGLEVTTRSGGILVLPRVSNVVVLASERELR